MYLSRVKIKNFRNLVQADIEFQQGLTVIVGENNVGKTNVIDAIRFALGPGSTGSARPMPRRSDLCRDGAVSSFSVDLTFSGIGDKQMGEFIECLNYNKESPESSTLELHYEWTWNEKSERYQERRWGGPVGAENHVPSEAFQAVPFVYLEPLRDALGTLLAGRSSRIGSLLRRMKHSDAEAAGRIEGIINEANASLEGDDFIKGVVKTIQKNITDITNADLSQSVGLATSVEKFDNIVNGLNLMLRLNLDPDENGKEVFQSVEIRENGLGYNNVLYIATILAELSNCADGDTPILCVEEPEAHLHPQLQILLGEYFKSQSSVPGKAIQVILTTHSPNLASHLPLDRLCVFHRTDDEFIAAALWKSELSEDDRKKIERLIDVTKASLFFAKAVIFVEGVCEQLLLPGLARQLGCEIQGKSVSVIPVHGLSYVTLSKLFGEDLLRLKCAIVTDGDPEIESRAAPVLATLPDSVPWKAFPAAIQPAICEETNSYVKLFRNGVTLEYDMAAEGDNAAFMAKVWRKTMKERVPQLTQKNLALLGTAAEKAVFVWQALCMVNGGKHKAAFAQELAASIDEKGASFVVPGYIRDALAHVGCFQPERARPERADDAQ